MVSQKSWSISNTPALLLSLFLLLIGGILYWNSLHTPFMWDEGLFIMKDPRIQEWPFFLDIFKKPFYSGKTAFTLYYRPLSTLSFRMDYLFWGLNPFGYHLTNLFLHLANTLIIYTVYRHFLKNVQLAFWGAFLFLAHPAHVEAVTYIPSRTDVLSFFFFLSSFYLYVKGREAVRKFWPYLGSALCYGFALFSKERAAFLPFLILAHALLIDREKTRFKGAEGALLLGMSFCIAGYVFVRQYISIHLPFLTLLDLPRFLLRLFFIPEIISSYVRIWFFPWPLHMGRMIPIEVLKVQTLIFEWVLFLIFLAVILLFFRKPLERFWLVWIVVSLLPVIQIFPIYFNSPCLSLAVSEYLLYFASVGVIGLLACRFGSFFVVEGRGHLLRSAPTVLLGAVLTLFSFSVIWRNGEYGDRITLFEQTVHYAPWHAVAYNQLGVAYLTAGDNQKAEALFRKSLSIVPVDGYPYLNLGNMAQARGDLKKAEMYYKKGLELLGPDSVAFHNLGFLAIKKKDWRQAIHYFDEAIKADPYSYPVTYSERAHAYWELGEKEKAQEAVKEGLKIYPSDPDLQNVKRWIQEQLSHKEAPWDENILTYRKNYSYGKYDPLTKRVK